MYFDFAGEVRDQVELIKLGWASVDKPPPKSPALFFNDQCLLSMLNYLKESAGILSEKEKSRYMEINPSSLQQVRTAERNMIGDICRPRTSDLLYLEWCYFTFLSF